MQHFGTISRMQAEIETGRELLTRARNDPAEAMEFSQRMIEVGYNRHNGSMWDTTVKDIN